MEKRQQAEAARAITRFRTAISVAVYHNHEVARYVHTPGMKNPPGPIPAKLIVDRFAAIDEVMKLSRDALRLFRELRFDASAVFHFLRDVHLIWKREPFHEFPAIASLENLQLHIGYEPEEIEQQQASMDGEWSIPMSKQTVMKRLGIGPSALKTYAKHHPLRMLGRQSFQIRIDRMDDATRAKIQGVSEKTRYKSAQVSTTRAVPSSTPQIPNYNAVRRA